MIQDTKYCFVDEQYIRSFKGIFVFGGKINFVGKLYELEILLVTMAAKSRVLKSVEGGYWVIVELLQYEKKLAY